MNKLPNQIEKKTTKNNYRVKKISSVSLFNGISTFMGYLMRKESS